VIVFFRDTQHQYQHFPNRWLVHEPTREALTWGSAMPTDFCGVIDEIQNSNWIIQGSVFLIRRLSITDFGNNAISPPSMEPINLTVFGESSGFYIFEIGF
jgi:hypothetical protein